jgi:hypothetical protein
MRFDASSRIEQLHEPLPMLRAKSHDRALER